MLEEFLMLANGLASMAALTLVYGVVQRKVFDRSYRHVVLGFAFGAGATLAMLQPIPILPGVFVDARSLFIGFAGAFVGWRGALVAFGVAAAARLAIGGPGAVAGVVNLTLAAGMGLLWPYAVVRLRLRGLWRLLLLGAMISLSLLALLLLPAEVRWVSIREAAPAAALANLIGAVLLGSLIERERRTADYERKTQIEADTDPLTGLHNRRSFERIYEKMKRAAGARSVALLLVDVDRFKEINDSHGHDVGDAVLQTVAEAMRRSVRGSDIIARLGGDEFGVLLPNISKPEAAEAGARLHSHLRLALDIHGKETINVTASVGGVHLPVSTMPIRDFIQKADMALYAAKVAGRDRFIFEEHSELPSINRKMTEAMSSH